MAHTDATDHALATIASILDETEMPPEVERSANAPKPAAPAMALTEGDDYSKIGPGPIAAIRFKWTARRGGNGDYFVDETIGESSVPVVVGPMSREAAIAMVDEREHEARRRFDQLRHEMSSRAEMAETVASEHEA